MIKPTHDTQRSHAPPSTPQPQTTTLLIPSHLCASSSVGIRRRERKRYPELWSYLRVSSVVVLFFVAAPDKDPRSTQPCPPTWARMWGCVCGGERGRSEVSLPICQPRKARRGARDESFPPGPKRRRLAHLLASPALPGHSSQPLSNRRAGERAFGGGGVGGGGVCEGERGEEVLKGLERTWNGEQGTSSPHVSLQPLDMLRLKPASTFRILPPCVCVNEICT